jgi:predicted flap endonuclease-1-like 5' DNA nuclease
MTVVLHKLYGVEPTLENKLKERGIKDSEDLLKQCRSSEELSQLAEVTGIEPRVLAQLVHRADLARIRGIGEAYTQLLEAAGVSTLGDLAARCPEDLRDQFTRINSERELVGRVPALAMVNGWVTKAKRLPKTLD